jgi:ribosomal protein S27AE
VALLSEARKQQIIDALREHGAERPCPRCGNVDFLLIDGYFHRGVQSRLDRIEVGGQGVPTIALVCNQCGFIAEHALGALGLLPEEGQP